MPFLLGLIPAAVGSLVSAGAGAVGNAIVGGLTPKQGTSAAGQTSIALPTSNTQSTEALNQAQGAMGQQNALVSALQGQNGIQNQSSVYNQLQGVASGTGPNPAQAMLAQSTGANTANQAALMASQRGTGANAGLIARQAAMQGGANQQAAAGQAATLQANQSLGALGQMGGVAGQQVGELQGATQFSNQAAQSQEQITNQQLQAQNALALNQQQGLNATAAGQAGQTQKAQQDLTSGMVQGATKGIGSAITALATPNATPAAVKPMELTPMTGQGPTGRVMAASGGPVSSAGKYLKGINMAKGGKVPAMVSPDEIYLPPKKVEQVAKGKSSALSGEKIKGKATVKGDSLKNDTVKKTLTSGGIVIPRSITESPDAAKKAAAFVAAIIAKKGLK